MGMEVTIEFLQKTTVRVQLTVRDDDDTLVDPTTSTTIDIWDKDGLLVADEQAMTPITTGIFEYYYNLAADAPTGLWRGICWALDGTKKSEASFSFEVKS